MEERLDRRGFLQGAGAAAGASVLPAAAQRQAPEPGPPPVTDPRATDGDERHEPAWDEHLTLSVGTREGDLAGKTERVIQAALDTVHRMGGGTVRLLPGTWRLRNAVFLPSKVRLIGSGEETILTREASLSVALVR